MNQGIRRESPNFRRHEVIYSECSPLRIARTSQTHKRRVHSAWQFVALHVPTALSARHGQHVSTGDKTRISCSGDPRTIGERLVCAPARLSRQRIQCAFSGSCGCPPRAVCVAWAWLAQAPDYSLFTRRAHINAGPKAGPTSLPKWHTGKDR